MPTIDGLKGGIASGLPLAIPAFILGNGPTLPADLSPLEKAFTVGVNRILRSGFTPTVVLWVDGSVVQEDGEQLDASGALLVCDKSVAKRQGHIGLQAWVGDGALSHKSTPTTLTINGNTGCCAVRWAIALGCKPVFLLGMSATYDGGKTDFYGENRWHHKREGDNGTLMVMSRELARLRADHADVIKEVPHADGILEVLMGEGPDVDQQQLRERLRTVMGR